MLKARTPCAVQLNKIMLIKNTRERTIIAQAHPFHILPPSEYPSLVGLFLGCVLFCVSFYLHGVDSLFLSADYNKGLLHLAFIVF